MRIGGFQKCSLIEYPGRICAVVFTQGCNFRCPYCHNPALVDRRLYRKPIPEKVIADFLDKRHGLLEAVTVTGGEPLLQKNIFAFLKSVKKQSYSVKLDTNGSFPEKLERIVSDKLVDYVAMDIKAPPQRYASLAGVPVDWRAIRDSIEIIARSGIPHHFRTTEVKTLLSRNDIDEIRSLLPDSSQHILQEFRPELARDPALRDPTRATTVTANRRKGNAVNRVH